MQAINNPSLYSKSADKKRRKLTNDRPSVDYSSSYSLPTDRAYRQSTGNVVERADR